MSNNDDDCPICSSSSSSSSSSNQKEYRGWGHRLLSEFHRFYYGCNRQGMHSRSNIPGDWIEPMVMGLESGEFLLDVIRCSSCDSRRLVTASIKGHDMVIKCGSKFKHAEIISRQIQFHNTIQSTLRESGNISRQVSGLVVEYLPFESDKKPFPNRPWIQPHFVDPRWRLGRIGNICLDQVETKIDLGSCPDHGTHFMELVSQNPRFLRLEIPCCTFTVPRYRRLISWNICVLCNYMFGITYSFGVVEANEINITSLVPQMILH